MNENKSFSDPRNDDMDLIILLEKIVIYFRRFRSIYIVAILVGIVAGVVLYLCLPKLYKSRMVVHPMYLTNGEQMQLIDNWNELLKRHEYASIAADWNCDEELIRKVSSIDATDIMKVFTPNNPNGFYVDVKVKNNSILPALQQAILFGLNNSEFVKEKLRVRRENIQFMIDEVNKEMAKLDSTKTNVDKIISNKEKNSSSLMIDVSGMNKELIDLNEKLLSYKEELKFVNGVFVIQGFSRFDTPVSISPKVMIIIGLIFFIVIAYIYTLIILVKERMRKLPGQPAA